MKTKEEKQNCKHEVGFIQCWDCGDSKEAEELIKKNLFEAGAKQERKEWVSKIDYLKTFISDLHLREPSNCTYECIKRIVQDLDKLLEEK